jgi:hypothetical protein|tara:strand:+ start:63465 stop:63764 length:300 start_codon:yes stop_codon:yes gene_type:complete
MDRKTALARLRAFEPELRRAGIAHMFLYGSVARNDAGAASDLDIAFEVDRPKVKFSLLDQARIQVRLSDAMGVPVDLLEREAIRDFARATAESDMVAIF